MQATKPELGCGSNWTAREDNWRTTHDSANHSARTSPFAAPSPHGFPAAADRVINGGKTRGGASCLSNLSSLLNAVVVVGLVAVCG